MTVLRTRVWHEVSSLMIRRQNLDGTAAAETRRRPSRPHDDA